MVKSTYPSILPAKQGKVKHTSFSPPLQILLPVSQIPGHSMDRKLLSLFITGIRLNTSSFGNSPAKFKGSIKKKPIDCLKNLNSDFLFYD